MNKQPAVYMLASNRNGTLYVGVTSSLVGRIWQHRNHLAPGFTDRYGVTKLVWYEVHETMESAIVREKQLKKWNRDWKLRLIEEANPYWGDLWPSLADESQDTGSPPARG
ncbi:MAG TPA: GIY-YIG nuclease family protein [Luteimonas sp.]|nr:GIY-YIG nuclease family protein [Luteimonas sp.]HRO26145.1 GIY-YIG nuclease family protein [Luteimonas sp.]HRP71092.1 GIY-YIG nuclease family protein [Luteimonas sp.]